MLGLVGEGGQSDELDEFMQSLQAENAALHAACAAGNAASTKSLLELTALPNDKAASKRRIKDLTQHLGEELSARDKYVANKRPTEDAVAEKKELRI